MCLARTEFPVVPPKDEEGLLPDLRIVESYVVAAFRTHQIIVKTIGPKGKIKKRTIPAVIDGINTNKKIQNAMKGHTITVRKPIKKIREKWLLEGKAEGPIQPEEIQGDIRFVVLAPQKSKEDAIAFANTINTMVARRPVVKRWLRYLFKHSHSRLYPADDEKQALSQNEGEKSKIKCVELFIVDE